MLLGTPRSAAVLLAIEEQELIAPDLLTVEVISALRRLVRQSGVTIARANEAMSDLVDAPIRLLSTRPLTIAIWRLRDNLSAYDACYVALAESLNCPLVSADERLAQTPGLPIRVIIP